MKAPSHWDVPRYLVNVSDQGGQVVLTMRGPRHVCLAALSTVLAEWTYERGAPRVSLEPHR